ncbi:MAG: hypothetical protein PVJ09_00300 [Candidatus Woesebacteria bacterium]|jgi:hypothetical protein
MNGKEVDRCGLLHLGKEQQKKILFSLLHQKEDLTRLIPRKEALCIGEHLEAAGLVANKWSIWNAFSVLFKPLAPNSSVAEVNCNLIDQEYKLGGLIDSNLPLRALTHVLRNYFVAGFRKEMENRSFSNLAQPNLVSYVTNRIDRSPMDPENAVLSISSFVPPTYGVFNVGVGAIFYRQSQSGNPEILVGERRKREGKWSPNGLVIPSETMNIVCPNLTYLQDYNFSSEETIGLENWSWDLLGCMYDLAELPAEVFLKRQLMSMLFAGEVMSSQWNRAYTLQGFLHTLVRMMIEELVGFSIPSKSQAIQESDIKSLRESYLTLRQVFTESSHRLSNYIAEKSSLLTMYLDISSGVPWLVPIIALPVNDVLGTELGALVLNSGQWHKEFDGEARWVACDSEELVAEGPRFAARKLLEKESI